MRVYTPKYLYEFSAAEKNVNKYDNKTSCLKFVYTYMCISIENINCEICQTSTHQNMQIGISTQNIIIHSK